MSDITTEQPAAALIEAVLKAELGEHYEFYPARAGYLKGWLEALATDTPAVRERLERRHAACTANKPA